jgi:hypothetical protein
VFAHPTAHGDKVASARQENSQKLFGQGEPFIRPHSQAPALKTPALQGEVLLFQGKDGPFGAPHRAQPIARFVFELFSVMYLNHLVALMPFLARGAYLLVTEVYNSAANGSCT